MDDPYVVGLENDQIHCGSNSISGDFYEARGDTEVLFFLTPGFPRGIISFVELIANV